MASINNHILTIVEPTIELDKMEFESFGEGEGNDRANISQDMDLVVSVNKYTFDQDDIVSMNLDCTSTLPTLDITIIDSKGMFNVDTFPRDGDVINLRIGTRDKTTYKAIRMDFDIVYVETPPQKSDLKNGRYSFTGRVKIPGLYSEDCKTYGVGTSLDHIEQMASDLKLGLATNIDSTDDEMNLVVPFNSMIDTMNDLVRHSYVDDDSFQVYSIDPYYYVNFVNINSLLDSEETLEDAILAFDTNFNDMKAMESEENKDSINQAQLPLVLSNHARDESTNRFITGQSLRNRAGAAAKKNGYKRILQYYENDSEEGLVSHDIEAIASKNMKDIEEPLRGRRDEDRYKNEVKYKYVGRKSADPETANTHLNYEYAAIANSQNMDEVKKLSLDIELSSFNPAIHRYQKIPIVIYTNDFDRLKADSVIKTKKEEGGFETEKPTEDGEDFINPGRYVVDEFLTGFYVVGGIQYTYRRGDGAVRQKLNLLRREWPSRINNINEETVKPKSQSPKEPTPPQIPTPETTPPPAPVPVDAVMGEWSEWGSCVDGQQTRTRVVVEPAQNGGVTGELEETQECTVAKYLYELQNDGLENELVVFNEGVEVYRSAPDFSTGEAILVQEAKNSLDPFGEDPDIQNMQKK